MLPPQIDSTCPSSITVQKDDCKVAGQTVGGILVGGEIGEGSETDRPSGCSFGPVINFNINPNGVSNSDWHPICHKMRVRRKLMEHDFSTLFHNLS